ncbi:HAD family hydrolase [Maritalea porphyrae]|uniref:phosphoglycolate phosphatase n=1 Tax=Maritalea porphyrae TaxID=880732 RepID=A0ABQ5URB9_9HYPH|nr:HAD-IA family hydrolase [Maritalea porphyrae]GLQ17728.1 hypothetical protein GCM10007879_19770 [Maritalea porphyrae]
MANSKPKFSVLVTDVDNTLFDWFEVWHSSFKAMLDQIVIISGVSEEELYPEIRKIHQKHGTSEYAFLIGSLPVLKSKFPDENLLEIFQPAIDAFRSARREKLKLYEGVLDTLQSLKAKGTTIIAYTESKAFYTAYRFKKLELDGVVDILFSPPDHELPEGETLQSVRSKPSDAYGLKHTKHIETPDGELKPNPNLLLDIISSIGADPKDVVYVGDSRVKDIAMAQDAGVSDVFAAYGASHHRDEYNLLVNVTHWSDADVQREKRIGNREVTPSYTLGSSFTELLDLFDFENNKDTQ